MKMRELAALIVAVLGMIGLVAVALIQTAHNGQPQGEVLVGLIAVTTASAQWVFRNGSSTISRASQNSNGRDRHQS